MTKIVATLLLILSGSVAAQDCTCRQVKADPLDWARGMYQSSTYVFFGTVVSVSPPMISSNETRDQPTVRVTETYKGNFSGGEIRNFDCGTGVLPGESVMFFLDGYKRIKSCSTFPKGLTEHQIKAAVTELSGHGT